MRLLKCDEMKQVEKYTSKFGLSYQRMMENAGASCAKNIRSILEKDKSTKKNVAVVCGKGNNGGDGFVIARKFSENGYNVCIILATGYPSTPESEFFYKMATDMSIPTVWYDADSMKAIQTVRVADVIVDAVFGFSFYGTINGSLSLLIKEMSAAKGMKFAIDVPSGVHCDSGFCDKNCFHADYTIAISALKPAHIIHPAADCCGDIIVANIGIPEESFSVVGSSMFTYNSDDVASIFPRRSSVSNKGDFGHLLSICGSRRMPGAAFLAAKAALRCGAGLVTAAFPKSLYQIMSIKLDEALLMPLEENSEGSLSKDCIPYLLENLDKYDAITIGCGLSVNEDTAAVVKAVLENAKVPVVVDADGINIISQNIELLQNAASPVILTPHPKEMSRLISSTVEQVQNDRVFCAENFAKQFGVYVVLKGSNTVVACPDSKNIFINASGNNGLAKGGSGDVLAGMIGSLTAQHFAISDAVCAGVFVHGHCADIVAERLSKTGMLPTDVIDELAGVFAEFE